MGVTGKPRSRALDGLRGVAIAGVLVFHLFAWSGHRGTWFAGGGLGVSVFFVLSGFLITGLLLDETRTTGRVDVRAFYVRRAARLLPALSIVLIGYVAIMTATHLTLGQSLAEVALPALFLANVAYAVGVLGGGLQVLWSLSVEEQFYAAWPWLVTRARGPRDVAVAAGLIAVLFAVARAVVELGGHHLVAANLLRFDAMAVGALAAVAASRGWRPPGWLVAVCAAAVPIAYVAPWTDAEQMTVVTTLLQPAVAVLAVAAPAWLGAAPLVWAGRRCYGLYLWNVLPIMAWLTFAHRPVTLPVALGLLAFTFVAADVSWRLVETPLIGRARDWSRSRSELRDHDDDAIAAVPASA